MAHDECPAATALKLGRAMLGVECLAKRPDGSRRWFVAYSTPLFDERQNIRGGINMLIDVTQRKCTEQALRESEQRFRSLVALMPAGMCTCDSQGRITLFNDHAVRLWGRVPKVGDEDEKFCGSFRLYRPDGSFMPHVETPMAEAIRTGIGCDNREVTIERPDGTRRVVLVNIDPIIDATGKGQGAVNIFMDITDHQRAERERDRFFVLSKDLLGILSTHDGRWLRINAAFSTVLGWTKEEMLTLPLLELVHPDDMERWRKAFDELAEGPVVNNFEHRVRCKDGGYKWIAWNAIPLPTEQLLYCVGRDMTARQQAEQDLRRSEERFRALSEAIPTMIWVCLPDGWLTYFNPLWSEYTGQTAEQYQGLGWVDVVHPQDRGNALARWEDCCRTGQPFEGEIRYRRHDGVYRWHYYRAVPVRGPSRDILAWYGASLDIEERKSAEAALMKSEERMRLAAEAANHAKSEFLANMSHEIRTPMTAILGYVDILAQYHKDPDDQSCLTIIRNNGNYLLEIINDILDVSKIDAGNWNCDDADSGWIS